MAEKRLSIQKILLPDKEPQASQWNLYYQGAELVCDICEDGTSRLLMGSFKEYNFLFLFSMQFHLEKWKKYTNVKKVYLKLEIKGDFGSRCRRYHFNRQRRNREKLNSRKRFKNAEEKV